MQRANIVQRNVQRQARDNTSKESAIVASFPFSRVHRFAPKIPLIRVISEGRASDCGFRASFHPIDSCDRSHCLSICDAFHFIFKFNIFLEFKQIFHSLLTICTTEFDLYSPIRLNDSFTAIKRIEIQTFPHGGKFI